MQQKKLFSILQRNEDSVYGKKYNFKKIKTIKDFQTFVPLTIYEDYKDYIDRIINGEQNILTNEPVIILEPTSGSVTPTKLIPYTKSLFQEFRNGISAWFYDLFENKPGISNGSFYWSITPATSQNIRTKNGILIGFGDDRSYFTCEQQEIISKLSSVPFDVAKIHNIEEFKDLTLITLLNDKNLAFISIWNPTFLLLLLRPLLNNPDLVIRKIKDKTRSKELENIFFDLQKKNYLKRIWTKLSLISMWVDGNAAMSIREVEELFPEVEIQGKGLIATEGFISFPLVEREGAALSINSHFFEFKERDKKNNLKLAHELELGKQYEVILTNSGGLYRYNLQDIVKVVGFKNQCPLLRFVGRSSKVSDLFGEKLNESNVEQVIKTVFKQYLLNPSFYMIAPEYIKDQNSYSYTLFLELGKHQNTILVKVAKVLDERLQENYHYKYCRKLGQLGPIKIFLIDINNIKRASDIYLEKTKGKQIGSVKSTVLCNKTGWLRNFKGDFVI
ncbi:MAG: hypothetical protein A3I68_05970 [Candidatus Melainabacteria bacterium RIFCSPLOWO2_02_FULL_35_15]|nr:MAG: hypothetical protein A3F80_02200 [Candidatus Melainabacteria bacterium RIFCSPLOWO2_12_FULL_35_11]OGI13776.1 MAG: hypothetical protein A3I68_05970 [Candidatus Melainabacteria bacterium RIFCSPLOWO2_02_FULL_35_15]